MSDAVCYFFRCDVCHAFLIDVLFAFPPSVFGARAAREIDCQCFSRRTAGETESCGANQGKGWYPE